MPPTARRVTVSEKVTARNLGPDHIGRRVRFEHDGIAVEAPITRIGYQWTSLADPSITVMLEHKHADDLTSPIARVLSPYPSLTLAADDVLELL